MGRERRDRAVSVVLLAIALTVFALSRRSLHGYIGSDFRVFRAAAQRLLRDPATLYAEPWATHPNAQAEALVGFLYPPPSALLFVPLACGSEAAAFFWFGVAIIGAAAAALTLWGRQIARDGICLPGLPMFSLGALVFVAGPIAENALGQVNSFVLLDCIAATICLRNYRPLAGGALIALGAWVKIYPALLLIDLLRQPQRRRALGGFTVVAFALPLLSLLALPLALFVQYFGVLLPGMAGRTIINIDNQSLLALIARSGVTLHEATDTYRAVAVAASWRVAVIVAAAASFFAICWRTRDSLTQAAWLMALIPLIAPLGWGHSYAYAMPLWMLVAARAWDAQKWRMLVLTMIVLVALIPGGYRRLPFGPDTPVLIWMTGYARYPIAVLVTMALAWFSAAAPRPEQSAPARTPHP